MRALEEEGGADIRLRYKGSRPLEIECKNVLRQRLEDGTIRLDFQRTRTSKEDPCSRFYAPTDFDLVAACLHSCTESWEFRYSLTRELEPHKKCPGKLSNLVRIDDRWIADAARVLRAAAEPPDAELASQVRTRTRRAAWSLLPHPRPRASSSSSVHFEAA